MVRSDRCHQVINVLDPGLESEDRTIGKEATSPRQLIHDELEHLPRRDILVRQLIDRQITKKVTQGFGVLVSEQLILEIA